MEESLRNTYTDCSRAAACGEILKCPGNEVAVETGDWENLTGVTPAPPTTPAPTVLTGWTDIGKARIDDILFDGATVWVARDNGLYKLDANGAFSDVYTAENPQAELFSLIADDSRLYWMESVFAEGGMRLMAAAHDGSGAALLATLERAAISVADSYVFLRRQYLAQNGTHLFVAQQTAATSWRIVRLAK